MKKYITITAAIFITFLAKAQTTMEEYNYATKGYGMQQEAGLGIKEGYNVVDIAQISKGERKVILKELVRTTTKPQTIAAYILIYQLNNNPKEYICIPDPKSEKEINTLYWNALYNGNAKVNNNERLQLITYLISQNILKW